jgi:hypothetical protein
VRGTRNLGLQARGKPASGWKIRARARVRGERSMDKLARATTSEEGKVRDPCTFAAIDPRDINSRRKSDTCREIKSLISRD